MRIRAAGLAAGQLCVYKYSTIDKAAVKGRIDGVKQSSVDDVESDPIEMLKTSFE